ncbi:MFS transporter [Pseudogracilibacillus auburnensis]|uniref:MFS transporter n=1 Tax=Pseudogracilibacillus auburnensis TaxID=1494959 RepID=A0A2V3VGX9_9BACI|nr:MFS transporter [Pseudogracilibacillus auburnensis]PXW80444.1 MFS transporter [Pseudogracilibacillus auburnensis]
MTYKRFLSYQSTIMMASSMIFPFYVLLLKNVGHNYAQFGWAYGIFALTAAFAYPIIGKVSDKVGDKTLFFIYSFGMSIILLIFPLVTDVWHVYILQLFMGLLGAVQKNTEKTALARNVEKATAGKEIGAYHTTISIVAAIAIILTGYMVDFLTIASIFYVGSIIYIISAILLMKR